MSRSQGSGIRDQYRMNVKSFRELIVWQKAMDLATVIYRLIKLLPKSETYGLSDQMRRSAVSIPSNIAEGFGRRSTADYIRFLSIANGSLFELQTQLELCYRVGYLKKEQVTTAFTLSSEIGKMLNTMRKRLREQESGVRN